MSNVVSLCDYRTKQSHNDRPEPSREDLVVASRQMFEDWLLRQPASERPRLRARRNLLLAAMKLKW
ncbi:hypothetical protein NVP1031O_087 [Vibrio phage 1.031.O._10N.261.46.F8]|nr:hypothetical protein NVP1031O_087 [Vibrio phage 1.031.O._10N.261.46.F8]